MIATDSLLDAALGYAAAGFPVLPLHTPVDGRCDCLGRKCTSPGKHPRTRNGLTDATLDADTIRRWWGQWPTANVGIAVPNGYVVVDVDVEDPKSVLNGHSLTTTAAAKTGRGWQLLYSTDVPIRPRVGILEHVDVRGPGSYVVAPPSRHVSGTTYKWATRFEDVAPAPEWVASAARSARPIEAAPGDPIPDGQRNAALASLAGTMRRRGMTEAAILAALAEENRTRCVPPLPDDEVRAIAQSVSRYAPEEPHPTKEEPKTGGLRFYTAAEVATTTLAKPDWVVRPGLLAVGAITEIDGKIKAAGKTTLALHLVRAVLDGSNFLGEPTRRCRVIYVTEQSRQTFSDALRRAGLTDRGGELRILFRENLAGAPWPTVVTACRQDGYEVVVFDTIGKLAGIKEENSAGEWAVAMNPLQDLSASGRAVLIARHDRKGGGDVGESGRGSSQASGDVDIILALRRPEGNQAGTRRVIESLSRYPETPDKVMVELGPDGYALLGTTEAVAVNDARSFIPAALGQEFRRNESGLTREALVAKGREHTPEVREWAIRAALDGLTAEDLIQRSGRGVKGDPYTFTTAKDSFL